MMPACDQPRYGRAWRVLLKNSQAVVGSRDTALAGKISSEVLSGGSVNAEPLSVARYSIGPKGLDPLTMT